MSGFTALEKNRLSLGGWEEAGTAPDFPPGAEIWEKEKEKLFSGCLELWRGSWEGIWVGLGVSGVLQALGKAHFGKWRGKKDVKFQLWWQDWWFLGWLEHCLLLPSFLP